MTDIVDYEPKVITIDDLTEGTKDGNGAFDEIMRSVKAHLVDEHKAGRITGDQYTKAYIGSTESAMSTALQFVLQSSITNQNVRLLEYQIQAAEKNVELVQAQINKMNAETDLIQAQLVSETKRQLLLDEELETVGKQQVLLDKQIEQADIQTDILNQQLANSQAENNVITNTADKVQAETSVLEQKRITEQFQSLDTVDGNVAGGIIGKQMALYENQAEGYIRDAEQKAAKLFMDSFNTRTSIESLNENETLDATVTGTQIKDVMNKVREGVGVTPQA